MLQAAQESHQTLSQHSWCNMQVSAHQSSSPTLP